MQSLQLSKVLQKHIQVFYLYIFIIELKRMNVDIRHQNNKQFHNEILDSQPKQPGFFST